MNDPHLVRSANGDCGIAVEADYGAIIERYQRKVAEDDRRWHRQQAQYEAQHRAINAQIRFAIEIYAQSVAAAWYMALNPNIGDA